MPVGAQLLRFMHDNPLVTLGITAQMLEGLGGEQAHKLAKKIGRQTLANLHPDKTPKQFERSKSKLEEREERFQEVKEAQSEIGEFLSFNEYWEDLRRRSSLNTKERINELEKLLSAKKKRNAEVLQRVLSGLLNASPLGDKIESEPNSIFSFGLTLWIMPIERLASQAGVPSSEKNNKELRVGEDKMLYKKNNSELKPTGSMPLAVIDRSLAPEDLIRKRSTYELIADVHDRYNPSNKRHTDKKQEVVRWARQIPLRVFCKELLPSCGFTAESDGYLCSIRADKHTPVVSIEGIIQEIL